MKLHQSMQTETVDTPESLKRVWEKVILLQWQLSSSYNSRFILFQGFALKYPHFIFLPSPKQYFLLLDKKNLFFNVRYSGVWDCFKKNFRKFAYFSQKPLTKEEFGAIIRVQQHMDG